MKTNRNGVSPTNRHSLINIHSAITAGLAASMFFGSMSVHAQNRQVHAQPSRLTVQKGASGVITNAIVVITTNEVTPINLQVDMANLPAGVVSASLDTTSFLNPGGSATLTVNYNGSVPQTGTNEIGILATGDYTYRLPVPINSAVLWAGNTNANNWTTGSNWAGGTEPTSGDVVVFPSSGANNQGNGTYTNVVLAASREVAGVRFKHGDADNDQTYALEIKPGATLSVTGPNGFFLLQDTINRGGDMDVSFFGEGSLVVSNASAVVAMLKEAQVSSLLNLGGLNNFIADVDQLAFGNYRLYPYWTTNGYSNHGGTDANSRPARWLPQVRLAKTNVIRAVHSDPNNYNDPLVREYALTIGLNRDQGTTADLSFYFGLTNAFLMDSICFGQYESDLGNNPNQLRFNPNTNVIPADATPVIYFRNTNGGPMSVLVCADGVSEGAGGNAVRGYLNLSRGKVDAVVDRLYLGRDRLEGESRSPSVGRMDISDGTFIVNTAYLGHQSLTNNFNADNNGEGCESQGTLVVSNNAVFICTDVMHLGYTTADAQLSGTNNTPRGAWDGFGYLQVRGGGVAMINSIVLGGGDEPDATKLSINNRVSVDGGGNLIVTNKIGQPDKWLNSLHLDDGTLTLRVDAASSDPYIYTTNLTSGLNGSSIVIANVANAGALPVQIPLIKYVNADPNFSSIAMPSGLYGFLVVNEDDPDNKSIDLFISDQMPDTLIWDGSPATTWADGVGNWKASGIFNNGDSVIFDETASTKSVAVSGTVIPGGFGVVFSNTSPYTVTGDIIAGTASVNKWGTGTLTMEATDQLLTTINEGKITGTGELGATTVNTNSELDFSGVVKRLTSSGTSRISGSVLGMTTINSGTLTNVGQLGDSVTLNGGSNTTMVVPAGGSVVVRNGVSTVGAGTTLVMNGGWTNGVPNQMPGNNGNLRVSIRGTVIGTGAFADADADTNLDPGNYGVDGIDGRISIDEGGILSPGDFPGQVVTNIIKGRLDIREGGTLVIDVAAPGVNDKVRVDRWGRFPGTIRMNNVGTTYAAGQAYRVLERVVSPNAPNFAETAGMLTNEFPNIDPPSPGLGLLWDLRAPTPMSFRTNGFILVKATGSTPPYLTATNSSVTNLTFSWPETHIGWELLTQTRRLTNGLSLFRTNWTVVPGSTLVNAITITNWINTNSQCVFYQLAHPEFE